MRTDIPSDFGPTAPARVLKPVAYVREDRIRSSEQSESKHVARSTHGHARKPELLGLVPAESQGLPAAQPGQRVPESGGLHGPCTLRRRSVGGCRLGSLAPIQRRHVRRRWTPPARASVNQPGTTIRHLGTAGSNPVAPTSPITCCIGNNPAFTNAWPNSQAFSLGQGGSRPSPALEHRVARGSSSRKASRSRTRSA